MNKVFWAVIVLQLAFWALVVGLQVKFWESSPERKIIQEQPCDGPNFGFDLTVGPLVCETDMWDI